MSSTVVAVVALVLAYVALVAAYFALRTLAKLRRHAALLSRGALTGEGKQSLIEATGQLAEQIALVGSELDRVRAHTDEVRQQTLDDLTRVERTILERAEQVRLETLAEVARGEAATEGALRHTALVRYDAFPGMSGHMSFSLALLDETGTGLTISALAGQDDTRVYAKGVSGGRGEHELSPEEQQAVTAAIGKRRMRKSNGAQARIVA